jgi:hypothetical protein
MTEFENALLERIDMLAAAVEALRSENALSRITYFENLAPGAVVGADYVAYKFSVSESAVIRGRFDTDRIRRFRQKPLAFIKREVDAVFMELTKPSSEVAAEYRHKINQKMRDKKL